MNEEIRAREVRVVDPSGNQLGIMPLREALRLAEEHQLDLVEIAPQARPPVCRLMDYGKYKYEQSKREKEARKKQRVINIKEVKLRPSIEEHDFQVKVRNAARFLKEGDKVKATIMFRGREIMHTQLGHQLLLRLAEQVKDLSIIERQPRLEGKNMVMILAPRQDIKPESKQESKQETRQEIQQEAYQE
ncbi:translation initiation factor IF-3 [Desulfofundulus australicus DSM 11792]|uniref:Translation initiation factor IF-3 n=1 Tax=Desulfofundulus australicus DSM 11792 TaxID=1121425 RepID=A0A1M5BZ12_9FIRM|nr:translation initiation factor IF-3 [Desulfofundulus australicus]MDK2888258.1 translation initiation factor [Thermoanaerobacter sp.]SHF47729.1 translation initiation factor IF-3 [Desulfofundulus australicus DSM 11792]